MNKITKIILITSSTILANTVVWGALTKTGYIPNFLDLEILCPGEEVVEVILPIETDDENIPDKISEADKALLEKLRETYHENDYNHILRKPVIYLYPPEKTDIKVQLDYQGQLIADYPEYDESIKGWNVTAEPDSTIINHADGQEYSYLFWEGMPESPIDWDLSTGFVVKGSDTRTFLQKHLKAIGLTPKEYNEFIVYWYPLMMNNEYNLIHFAEEQYTDTAPLTITPTPDSMLRVFMVYKPLKTPIEIKPQAIKPFERKGFTVVEWGGSTLK